MSLIPLRYPPGVCKANSPYATQGRYTDMDKIRFVDGFPERIGGASIPSDIASSNSDSTKGVKRGLKDWRDNSGVAYLAVGSNANLRVYTSSAKTDITPLRGIVTGTLTNPLTTNATTTVSVAHTAHGLATGDYVLLVTGTIIDGIQPAGVFTNITVTNANAYTITVPTAATGSTSGGGGTVTYTYYRATLTNPFDTTISSATVTVHHTAHGATVGDYVTIAGASAVGGITPSGEVAVVTVPDANTWTFTWTSNATSSVSGGGGTPSFLYSIASDLTQTRIWSLDNYGQQLLASPSGGTIYVWDPTIGGRAYPLYNAPVGVLAMFVTPERFVFALGKTGGAMIVQWPDQTDYTQWTAAVTNTANSRTLQEGSFLVGGVPVRDGVSLIWSNTTCYQFNYTGDNNVYASSIAGRACGLIGTLARVVLEDIAYWMSGVDLWKWNGSVQRLPSEDIREYVFTDLSTTNKTKCCAGALTSKGEVWFFYPSSTDNTGDNSRYAMYSTIQQCLVTGTFPITSFIDKNLFSSPFVANDRLTGTSIGGSFLFAFDQGTAAYGGLTNSDETVLLTFSPMDISSGDKSMDIFAFIPDWKTISITGTGQWELTINTQDYPADSITACGPYTLCDSSGAVDKIDLRIGAKLIGGKIALSSGATPSTLAMRLGLPRVEAQPAGARR